MTEGEQWFDCAVKLHQEKVATPVIWLGDDRHYEKAKNFFGDSVVYRDLILRHRPYKIENIKYEGEKLIFLVHLSI